MDSFNAKDIALLSDLLIQDWHQIKTENQNKKDEIRKNIANRFGNDELFYVISDLIITNTEIWHEEDKVRSDDDKVVLEAIRKINPYNQKRNDLIEKIDELV